MLILINTPKYQIQGTFEALQSNVKTLKEQWTPMRGTLYERK